jgi:hypothetical protein
MQRTYLYVGLTIPTLTALGILACSAPPDTYLSDLGSTSTSASVEQLFATRCALSGCHGDTGTPAEGLVLAASVALRNTVNVPATQDSTRKLIAPGQPALSYLFCKVDNSCSKIVGSHMPPGGPLSATELDLLRTWIGNGAGGVNDGGAPPPADMTVVDTTPPTFSGLTTATPSPSSIALSWTAASDNICAATDLKYLIYQATAAGAENFAAPTYVSAPGATSYTVGKLSINTKYYFVVRAQDLAGNIDSNRVEQSATTPALSDTTPPTFAGIASATPSGNSITLTWTAATDIVTAPSQIVYLIYQASSPGGESYASPTFTTTPGATQYVVSGLNTGMTYYFVVRAQDQAGNINMNTVEKSATPLAPSLATQVQPIFTKSCIGGGCHAGLSPAQGLDLSLGKSYTNLVNVASTECTTTKRVLPSTPSMSYLMFKLQGSGPCFTGTRMPKGAPLAAADINTISAWIAAGAPNN